jgi:DNA (cytosine-5)-methyltransferase 1
MKYLSCFSGVEAATLAWRHLGWEAVGFSEINPFSCSVLAHRFPNVKNYGDIKKHEEWPIEPGTIDLLVGGSPCQSFSVAGFRQGLADPRGDLSIKFLRLAQRLKPRWIVWENVPGILSSNGGRDLGSFLGALGELGYWWSYRVLDAKHFGVPQRRRRLFLVAHSSERNHPAEVLSFKGCVAGHYPSVKQNGPEPSSSADGCAGDERVRTFRKSRRAQSVKDFETWVESDVSNTINAFDIGEVRTTHILVQDGAARRFTPVETERLMGFPDDWTKVPHGGKPASECEDRSRYVACGNSMAVPVMRWIGNRISMVDKQFYNEEQTTIHPNRTG